MQAGLVKNQSQIQQYRYVLQDLSSARNSQVYRDIALDILDKILDQVFDDPILFNRLRQNLMSEEITHDAYELLEKKANKSGLSLETILEVYRRGENQLFPTHLSKEERGFNRLNSYLAKGKAWHDDADLREMKLDPDDRLDATDSLRDTFKDDTPGESRTLKRIKKLRRTAK